jgi:hypothetical protein
MAEKPDSSGATVFVQLELFGVGYRYSFLYVGREFMREHIDYCGCVCVLGSRERLRLRALPKSLLSDVRQLRKKLPTMYHGLGFTSFVFLPSYATSYAI